MEYESAVLPKFRRRLESVDGSLKEAWLRGLSQRDCEPTLRALLGGQGAEGSPSIQSPFVRSGKVA